MDTIEQTLKDFAVKCEKRGVSSLPIYAVVKHLPTAPEASRDALKVLREKILEAETSEQCEDAVDLCTWIAEYYFCPVSKNKTID